VFGETAWGSERSARYQTEITSVFNSLALFPELGRRLQFSDARITDARAIDVGTHVVYYRLEADEIRVLRVLHYRALADNQLE
jgi:plasmid stabilization system protein ParE